MNPSPVIDLRSDTVTRPTAGMRAAMAAAELGDDVYGDDPTVNRLQAVAAERFGYEAALWFPTGTQSNLAGLMSHCQRGDEYLVGQDAHTYKWEQGGAAVLGSIQPQPISNQPDGSIALPALAAALKPDDVHFARTRLLALENTIGGKVLPPAYVVDATRWAKAHGLATHLDGARLYNAIVKLGISEADAVAGFDSCSVCLSKGLGAPAGTVLLGDKAFVAQAKRWRKALGGGLRQAGLLAAAGLYAMEHHVQRLAEDHANAARLGEGLAALGFKVDPVQTNLVFFEIPATDLAPLKLLLATRNILATLGPKTRFATHLDLTTEQVDIVIDTFRRYLEVKQHAAKGLPGLGVGGVPGAIPDSATAGFPPGLPPGLPPELLDALNGAAR